VIILGFIIPITKEEDWHCYHVWECEECHKQDLGFAICSGFCFDGYSNPKGCVVNLNESCKEKISHGSNLGQKRLTFGIYGYLTTDTSICHAQDRPIYKS